MLLNVVFSFVPRPFTTAMIATEIPAAMRPYSMAVAPHSSFRKRHKLAHVHPPMGLPGTREAAPADIADE
jgi:hypothetical protein